MKVKVLNSKAITSDEFVNIHDFWVSPDERYAIIEVYVDELFLAVEVILKSEDMHPDDEPHYRKSGGKGRIIPVREGDTLDLGGRELKIIHLPGHTAGSIAVLDMSRRVLISGDPIQEHGRIFMFGEHRNMQDYIASLEHLKSWTDEFDEIWPSHADIPVKSELIGKLHDGAQRIMDGAVGGKPEEFHGHEIVAYDLGFTTILCDR